MAKDKIKIIREEMLQVAETVAREKNIEKSVVFEAMEEALQKVAKSKYGLGKDIRINIDQDNGNISLFSYRKVVESIDDEEEENQILIKDAKKIEPSIELDGHIKERLPMFDFGRVAAQIAKGVIFQKVREADKSRQYNEYKDKVGEIAIGIVKRIEFGNIIVDLGKAEAIIKREEIIPRENFKNGDRVRSYIYEVKEDSKGPQIFLSRTHPQFLAKLFFHEVPEIYDGIIEIKNVARDPGSRAKIAVSTKDATIDPVGSCVGMRGSRVQAVVSELQGEKIDIVPWSENQATFTVNALAPAEVLKILINEESSKVEVVIVDDQLSLAIGRRGQNVRLASMLTNLDIEIITESEEADRRQEEFKLRSSIFINELDVEDIIAQLLVTEGYSSIEEIANQEVTELEKIEGFDNTLATEINQRATNYIKDQELKNLKIIKENDVEEELKNFEGLNTKMLAQLAINKVKSLNDFADLSTYELIDENEGILKDFDIDETTANKLIMKARENWLITDNNVKDV
ncbi:MAG: hypothetical protein CFH21_00010 [Alphaproteobacteria bacterium MarineAlpha5_Bin11]|nr:MAG: hypothetical protein CFH21_00010 [Alphaproteobacteria bacterium MarineAlpha5_Bin11]PPR52121.1 MAG: hypothetical protein CFH20_00026 [Alphaproteobacteria bacterium MarineAlpha5_Bin10]|tara:strand:+ start:12916 stop:14463 length:1548 start_codon:yes stop_codon:yes gene_type:complete